MIGASVMALATGITVSAAAGALVWRRDAAVVDRLPGRPGLTVQATGRSGRIARFLREGMTAMPKVPRIVLARRHRRRLRQVDREIPLLLDALSSAAVAGLPPQSALRRAATVVDGPLGEELRTAVHAVDLGARWREQLDLLVARCPLRDLSRAVGVMSRTDALGVSFADGMTTLAVRAREARRADLTQRARTAPVKMLFPLVFLVLPAFLLLTVVPLLVATLDQIR